MKRRVRVLPPGYLVGTKGHSVLKKKTYSRKPLIEVEEFYPHTMPTSRRHDLDSGYMGSFYNATKFSNAVMDDSYDLQSQSRGRDHRLLSHMNSALVSTDFSRPPKAAVAVLRASRKTSSQRITRHPLTKEVPDTGPYYLSSLAGYIPGRTKRIIALSSYSPYVESDAYPEFYPRSKMYRPSADPVYIRRRAPTRSFYSDRYYLPWYAGWRAVARGRYLRSVPRSYYGRYYQLPELTFKALLVGDDKLDDPDRPRLRKPRTRYYADKLHKLDHKENLSTLMAAPHTPHTVTVKASRPAKYRLDSRLEPEDLLSKPTSYGSMRDQVRGVQDKLDRHRQLMDRYTDTDFEVDPLAFKKHDLGERITTHSDRVGADAGHGDSHAAGGGLSAGRTTEEGGAGGDGLGKVSPLRKKLRKVICKSRHDPSYYDE